MVLIRVFGITGLIADFSAEEMTKIGSLDLYNKKSLSANLTELQEEIRYAIEKIIEEKFNNAKKE